MLTCRELTYQADDYLAGELPWRRRLALRMHILMCVHCRRYLRQLRQLVFALSRRYPPASREQVEAVMRCLDQAPTENNA